MKNSLRWRVLPTIFLLVIILMPAVCMAFSLNDYTTVAQLLSLMSENLIVNNENYQVEENIIYGTEKIGDTTGTLSQSGYANLCSELYLGYEPSSRGIYNLSGGALLAKNEYIGLNGTGTFTQSGGSNGMTNAPGILALLFGDTNLYLGYNPSSSGTYELQAGSLTAKHEYIGYLGTGTFTQSGGINTLTHLFVGVGALSSGTYNLEGGTLSAGNIAVNPGGALNITGVTTKLTTTVTGNVINTGPVKTTNTDVTWNGTFTNNGAYMSDPSTQTFSDLVVGSSGYLVAASQDLFIVTDDFINQSTQNTLWDTGAAILQFATGSDIDPTLHALYIPGTDLGATTAGYTNNFAWGTLTLDTGQTVTLFDGSDSDGGALYVEIITGLLISGGTAISNITGATKVVNIYYNPFLPENDYLNGLTYAFASGNGQLIPTPLPASLLLLGSGLLGLGFLGWRRRRLR